MAWSTPSVRATGDIITAAIWNQDVKDNTRYLKGMDGAVTIEDDLTVNGFVTIQSAAGNYLQVPSLTTAQRDALTAANGMVIYNSTLALFQRRENGAWISYNDLAKMTIASIAQGDVFYRGASDIERLAPGTAGYVLQTNGAAANPSWVAGASSFTLLKTENGATAADAAAADVSTFALASQLTAFSSLLVIVENRTPLNAAGALTVRNATDSLTFATLANVVTNREQYYYMHITRQSFNAARVSTITKGFSNLAGPTADDSSSIVTFTTAWIGAWTIALRYAGGGSGGETLDWGWRVYHLKGV